GFLPRGEAGLVDAVVEGVVDAPVDRVDFAGEVGGIEIAALTGNGVEGAVQHADDVGGFVVDDGPALLVPQDRHGRAAAEAAIGALVDLVDVARPGERIGCRKAPAVFEHQPLN